MACFGWSVNHYRWAYGSATAEWNETDLSPQNQVVVATPLIQQIGWLRA